MILSLKNSQSRAGFLSLGAVDHRAWAPLRGGADRELQGAQSAHMTPAAPPLHGREHPLRPTVQRSGQTTKAQRCPPHHPPRAPISTR